MLQRGHGGDGCILCKYDVRKGNLFVLCWARVPQLMRGSISVAICLETIDVCIYRMCVFMSVVVTVWGSVGMFVV